MSDGVFYERVTLPSGGWVDLRPPETITERGRRPLLRLLNGVDFARMQNATETDFTDEEFDRFMMLNDQLAVAFVAAWSYEAPVTLEAVQDLPTMDYDALRDIVAPKIGELFPNFTPDEGPPDPLAPAPTGN